MVDMINELLIDNRKSLFGTMPTGEHLRFQIGRFENGPAILPFCISLSIFSLAAKGFCTSDFKFFVSISRLEPS